MFADALKLGQKIAAGAGFAEDPDVVAEREANEALVAERKQRLQIFFENERMVLEEVEERSEFVDEDDDDAYWEDECCGDTEGY
jgi:hypothetical protein